MSKTHRFLETEFFDDQAAIQHLTFDKVESCATGLTTHYNAARAEGLSIDEAYEKAMILHAHFDHDAGQEVPDNFPHATDEQCVTAMTASVMGVNEDGRAGERLAIALENFYAYRSWGVNIFYSSVIAMETAANQWDRIAPDPKLNDEYILGELEGVEDEEIKNVMVDVYKAERAGGVSPRTALRNAVEAGESAYKIRALFQGAFGQTGRIDSSKENTPPDINTDWNPNKPIDKKGKEYLN